MRSLTLVLGLALALVVPAQAEQIFRCGAATPLAVSPTDSLIEARVMFVSFLNYTDALPTWADSFCVQVSRHIEAMSGGKQKMNLSILKRTDDSTKAWVIGAPDSFWCSGGYGTINASIMSSIGDSTYWANSNIDQIFAIHYQCTFGCTDCTTRQSCEDSCGFAAIAQLSVNVPGFSGGGTTQKFFYPEINETFNEESAKYLAVHEYGHRLLLSHSPGTDPPLTVNMGRYDVMRAGGVPNQTSVGLVPYHIEQLEQIGWLDVVTLAVDTLGLVLPDVRGPNPKAFRVNIPGSTQYFTFANHGDGEFDQKYSNEGLLVWHVLKDGLGQVDLAWDLESARGKFDGQEVPDSESGKDPLELSTADFGDSADIYDQDTSKDFALETNPSSALYASASYSSAQTVKTSFAIENVRRDGSDNLVVDVFVTPKQMLTFPVAGDTAAVDRANTIAWATRDSAGIDSVIGMLSEDGGSSFDTLFVDLANLGTYTWTPTVIDSDYVVRLISHDEAAGTGVFESGVFRVADRVPPAATPDLTVEFVAQTSVGLAWTAPGDDSTSGTATEYDIRYSTSNITDESNWASATKVSGEDAPEIAGTDELQQVSGLSSCTTYYFAMKTRDESHNWSPMSNVPNRKTSCGGGGPLAARHVSDGRPDASPARASELPMRQLTFDRTVTAGMPIWTVTAADQAGMETSARLAAGIHFQVADGGGGWRTRDHFTGFGSDSVFGLVLPRANANRVAFVGDFELAYVSGRFRTDTGDIIEISSAEHSALGDLTSSIDHESGGAPSHSEGDTLTLGYQTAGSTVTEGSDWFVIVTGSPGDGATQAQGIGTPRSTLPTRFALAQNQPNPFSAGTTIRFEVPRAENVRLEIFDLQGRRMATVANGRFAAGFHSVNWGGRTLDGGKIQPGVYIYRMEAGDFSERRKLVQLP